MIDYITRKQRTDNRLRKAITLAVILDIIMFILCMSTFVVLLIAFNL